LGATLIVRAINTLYGNIGRGLDERNWSNILQSSNVLEAAEQALLAMYQNTGYLLRNADHLTNLGYSQSQVIYTYMQMSERLGYQYSAAWAQGTAYEAAANLQFSGIQTQASVDQRVILPIPVLTISNDATGLLAQTDIASRLAFSDGTVITNLAAGTNTLLAEFVTLKSGQLVALNTANGRSNSTTQTVTIGTVDGDVYDASGAGAVVQYIFTGAGNDIITGGSGADIIYAGIGNDLIRAGQEDARIDGGDGTDTLQLFASFAVQDVFQLRNLEVIELMTGGLTLNLTGSFSTATLRAFATGASTITGSNGSDIFIGGTGNDVFNGAGSEDTFTGGAGNDTYTGGTNDDTFNIDTGTDNITDLQGSDVFVVSAGATLNATIAQEFTATAASRNNGGGPANAVFSVSLNADFADFSLVTITNAATDGLTINNEKILGGATITGTAGNDVITGQQGIAFVGETLIGGAGNDTINGGVGIARLVGGTGADAVSGGAAVDTFVMSAADSTARTAVTITAGNLANGESITFGAGVDVITGFVSGTDMLDVTTANNYTALGAGANAQALTANSNYGVRGDFVAGTGVFTLNFATGADLMVVTNAANANLDAASQTGIVILVGSTSIVAADFI
jgi:Ca2+-binding RTX toxin-like protein